jgi:hypothetical protein
MDSALKLMQSPTKQRLDQLFAAHSPSPTASGQRVQGSSLQGQLWS